jgi:hypothetical protein
MTLLNNTLTAREEKDQKEGLDAQESDHLEFLHGLGFVVPELVIGKWTKCAGEGKPVPSGSYCYMTRANELRNGGTGLVTIARRHGEEFKHRTLPKRGANPFFGLSPSSVQLAITLDNGQREQTTEELRQLEFLWSKALTFGVSGYLEAKELRSCGGLRFSNTPRYGRALVVPLRDKHKVLRGLQYIADNGSKRIVGRFSGNAFRIGKPQPGAPVLICEGLATGLWLHEATDHAVIVAVSCCNMAAVARSVRDVFPNTCIALCGDNDRHLVRNEGKIAAEQAAGFVSGVLAVPDFGDIAPAKDATDWLDLSRLVGREATVEQLKRLELVA